MRPLRPQKTQRHRKFFWVLSFRFWQERHGKRTVPAVRKRNPDGKRKIHDNSGSVQNGALTHHPSGRCKCFPGTSRFPDVFRPFLPLQTSGRPFTRPDVQTQENGLFSERQDRRRKGTSGKKHPGRFRSTPEPKKTVRLFLLSVQFTGRFFWTRIHAFRDSQQHRSTGHPSGQYLSRKQKRRPVSVCMPTYYRPSERRCSSDFEEVLTLYHEPVEN